MPPKENIWVYFWETSELHGGSKSRHKVYCKACTATKVDEIVDTETRIALEGGPSPRDEETIREEGTSDYI
jgi:hypothetical protein